MENDQHLNRNERNEVPDVVSSSAQGRKKFSGRLRLQRSRSGVEHADGEADTAHHNQEDTERDSAMDAIDRSNNDDVQSQRPSGIQRQDTEGGKSVRFDVSPSKVCPVSNSPIMPPNILISQSTQSTDSADSTNLPGILTSHKRSNTVQPRRTQQTGFDELRNVVRFLSFQADDNEDLESNDILGNGKINAEQNVVNNEKVPKRLEVAVDIVDGKNGGHRRSVRKSSYRSKEKRKKLQRLASMPGDTELNEYMDSLAREPERLTTPHNTDTGETILHLLAKEGKTEILQNLLDDPRVEKELIEALLKQDRLGWSPVMAAIKADSGGEEIVAMFLTFLEPKCDIRLLHNLLTAQNIGKDTLFTLLMRNPSCPKETPMLMTTEERANEKSRRLLFHMLVQKTNSVDDPDAIHRWVFRMVQQLLTPNSVDLTARSMREVIDLLSSDTSADQSSFDYDSHSIENPANFSSFSNKQDSLMSIGSVEAYTYDFERLFSIKDGDGNNLLMELAKYMKDDALREILTNGVTANYVTHSILLSTNKLGQTLLTLIEVNRESLSESLPLVLKREYGCHRRDMTRTEICLSEQLETSASASEIIQELHQLEPKSCCQILLIWVTLFLTSLTPNICLAMGDIFSDAYLTVEYYEKMTNQTLVNESQTKCVDFKNRTGPYPLEAYAACLSEESQFWYTIVFLLFPLMFYMTEFLTLRNEYEPTGLRQKIKDIISELKDDQNTWIEFIVKGLHLLLIFVVTFFALVLWQPVTAMCKFFRDGRYHTTEGTTKVIRRKEKRYVDLAASRGELIEVSIEAVFEPMVQGYIIFPSIISIIQRLAESVKVLDDGTVKVDFQLKSIETAQLFSIGISMVSLAWCFSEYNSTRKNMLLDITESPCSRMIMCLYMLLQVVARLLAFMLFTLYWGPGNFYPLMIFILIHMILGGTLHIIFSEDLAFYRNGHYLKFFHNVMMNSFATIYFHNYLRLDEMPVPASNQIRISQGLKSPDTNSDTEKNIDSCNENPFVNKEHSESETNSIKHEVMNTVVTINIDGKENTKENHCKTYTTTGSVDSTNFSRNLSQEECILHESTSKLSKKVESVKFIDSQRPGLHISTILRQIMFDVLYGVEFVVLLTFGFSSDVKDLIDQKRRPIIVSVIIFFVVVALCLKIFYYTVMHVWRNVILTGKKLIRQEIRTWNQEAITNISSRDYSDAVSQGNNSSSNNRSSRHSAAKIQKGFFKYVFVSRNTWILGRLKHIETTLIVLPKTIIEAIKGRGQDLEYNFTDVGRQVSHTGFRSWFTKSRNSSGDVSPRKVFASLKLNKLLLSLLFFPFVLLAIAINLAIIVLLLFGLLLTIPVAVLVFLYNLKSGFRSVILADGDEEGQNTLELPPEILENGSRVGSLGASSLATGFGSAREKSLFNSDPTKTLSAIQRELEGDGCIDLSYNRDLTADEFEVFTMLLLSLNRKKYPLKILKLDSCDITDEKLAKLAPLIAKFEKVTLNGSQKMTAVGWEEVRSTICSSMASNPTSVKLRKLELKITKNDDDVIRFRREIFLEELKGSTMTGEALSKIGGFIPRLEKVYLDDIFTDTNYLSRIKQTTLQSKWGSSNNDDLLEAWKSLARSIMCCRVAKRKLRCLSLPGCAINDEILGILSPALVTVKMVHLGRNPITTKGWEEFKNHFLDEDAATGAGQGGAALTHLSLNSLTDSSPGAGHLANKSTRNNLLLHPTGMQHLSKILPRLEEVDFSGQCDIGLDGWGFFIQSLKQCKEQDINLKLKKLRLRGCKMKEETKALLLEGTSIYHSNLEIDFGEEVDDVVEKGRVSWLKAIICSDGEEI